jgi:hypothetical protein
MTMTDPSYPPPFTLPPHANAEPHRRLVELWSRMTPEEKFQSFVDAGILTPEGELTEYYRESLDEPSPSGEVPERS